MNEILDTVEKLLTDFRAAPPDDLLWRDYRKVADAIENGRAKSAVALSVPEFLQFSEAVDLVRGAYAKESGLRVKRTTSANVYGVTCLGDMIDSLALILKSNPDAIIYFAFGALVPTTFDSYRGSYDQLALGFKVDGNCTVKELHTEALAADGRRVTGYKGGTYNPNRKTPLWADNYGNYSRQRIVSIEHAGGDYCRILTRSEDEE